MPNTTTIPSKTSQLTNDSNFVTQSTLNDGLNGKLDKADAGSDWNQNDETQPDYIKNRPFYTGNPVETVLVEESTVTFTEGSSGLYGALFQSTFEAKVGETYKVYWDGAAYECACVNFNNIPAIGNLSIMGAGSDTGESFVMIVPNGNEIEIATADTSASHTISISGFVPGIIKIDKKYLPDTVATTEYVDDSVSNPLNITGASVGQIPKITAVDADGKPTEWGTYLVDDVGGQQSFRDRFDGRFLQIAYSYVSGGGATNSREHYEHCAANNYDAVKADLRLTSDNKLVCCHDAGVTLDSNGRIVSYDSANNSVIHDMTKAQFMALTFNTKYDGENCRTCDVETFLQICKAHGRIAYITIRGEYIETTVTALVTAIRDANMVNRTIINSFTMDALTAVRAAEPNLYLSLVIDPFTASERSTALAYAQGKETCQICLFYSNGGHTLAEMAADSTIAAWISSCIDAGVRLTGAQANDAGDADTLLGLGFCGVQTRVNSLKDAAYDGLDISDMSVTATSTDAATTIAFEDAKGNKKTVDVPKLQATDAQVQAGVAAWLEANAKPTVVWSKNVLNVNDENVSMGYIASAGMINNSDSYWASGYIQAKQGDVLRSSLNGATKDFSYVAEYDSTKKFLTRSSQRAYTYTVSNESAAYIRVSWKTGVVSYKNAKAMLTLNNTDLSFEEYGSHTEGGLGEYLVLTSPNGKRWTLKVSDAGALSAEEIV